MTSSNQYQNESNEMTPGRERQSNRIKWITVGAMGLIGLILFSVFNAYHIGQKSHSANDSAKLVMEADLYAHGVERNQDWNKAVTLLSEAVTLGNHKAEYKLGSCYLFGRGTQRNQLEAVALFRRSAEGGYAEAQFNLSVCYAKGEGVAQSEEEMLKWLKLSAEQESPQAQYSLGLLYLSGQAVPLNKQKGIDLIYKAANQGVVTAQYQLSFCFELGDGVQKDLVQAYKWALIATRSGLSGGQEAVEKLQHQLTPDQVTKAEQLARE